MMYPKILFDPGHGIDTAGKRSPDAAKGLLTSPYYLLEYKWAREVSFMCCDIMQALGYDASMLVTEDKDIPLATRTDRVNKVCKQYGASKVILVSVHINAAAGSSTAWKSARGWSIYTSPGETTSDKIATEMYEVAKAEFNDPSREYIHTFNLNGKQKPIRCDWSDGDCDFESALWMLRKSNCPAVLVENFFQDNKEDVLYLNSVAGKGSCVHVITRGLENYIGKYFR